MRQTPPRYRTPYRQAALTVDVRTLVERHLRDLAHAGRLREMARSRDALAAFYRAQGNDAASYCLASAPDFLLAAAPGGGALLSLRRSGNLISWTLSELLEEAPGAANEIESRAIQLAGGPTRFRALSEEEQEALTTQAVEDVISRQRST